MTGDGHKPGPHDEDADEPLGPVTPDDETSLGDSPEVHDEISPHDLPVDHRPGGGVVAGVEVSTDGGLAWHPATGHSTWTPRGRWSTSTSSRACTASP